MEKWYCKAEKEEERRCLYYKIKKKYILLLTTVRDKGCDKKYSIKKIGKVLVTTTTLPTIASLLPHPFL